MSALIVPRHLRQATILATVLFLGHEVVFVAECLNPRISCLSKGLQDRKSEAVPGGSYEVGPARRQGGTGSGHLLDLRRSLRSRRGTADELGARINDNVQLVSVGLELRVRLDY